MVWRRKTPPAPRHPRRASWPKAEPLCLSLPPTRFVGFALLIEWLVFRSFAAYGPSRRALVGATLKLIASVLFCVQPFSGECAVTVCTILYCTVLYRTILYSYCVQPFSGECV